MRGHRFFFAVLLASCSREGGKRTPEVELPPLRDTPPAPSSMLFGPERIAPMGYVNIGEVEESKGTVSNADRVVAGMRAGFRACHGRGLVNRPDQSGEFRVRVAVGSEGQVTRADVEGANELSAETIGCIIRRIESASFARPDDSSATLTFSITLEPARRK